jgi:hypothetical protein
MCGIEVYSHFNILSLLSWIWAYWINPIAWSLRGLLINQYGSGKFGEEGNVILQQLGFVDSKLNVQNVQLVFDACF